MDLEVIENISSNGTFDPNTEYHFHRNHHVDTLITIFGLSSIVASILVIFITRRYQVLHTRTNAYVANLCLANIIYLIFSPLFLNLFRIAEIVEAEEICIVQETLMLLVLALFVFATVLILDWYVITYKSYKVSAKCRASYKLILSSVWLIVVSFFITICVQCAAGISVFPIISVITILFYIYFVILMIFIHISRFFRHANSNTSHADTGLELEIGTLFWFCWLPNFTSYSVEYFYSFDYELFTYCIAHMYPTILFTLLYTKDRHFRICCRNFFKDESLELDALQIECDQKLRFTLFEQ